MSEVVSVGNDIGSFLGGVLNPIFGSSTTTTQTSQGSGATPTPTSSNKNTTIVIVVFVVILLGAVGFFLLKKKQ